MSRSNFKGKFFKVNIKKKKWIKIYNKSFLILPEYINYSINIYNGKIFVKLKITIDMVGFKIGEFIYTKKRHIFKKKVRNGTKNNTNKFKIK